MLGRVVFFERLARWHRFLVAWYLFRGYVVYYKRLQDGCHPERWRSRGQAGPTIRQLEFDLPLYLGTNESCNQAFDYIEEIYDQHYAKSAIVSRLTSLFKSELLHLAFKKALLEQLSGVFYYKLLIERVMNALSGADNVLIVLWHPGSAYRQRAFSEIFRVKKSVDEYSRWGKFPWWLVASGFVLSLRERMMPGILGMVILGCSVRNLMRHPKVKFAGAYDIAVAIISPLRQLSAGPRSVDFLVDGQTIRKEQVLFVPLVRLSREEVDWLKDRDLQVSDHDMPMPWTVFCDVLRGIACIALATRYPGWLSLTVARLVRSLAVWRTFTEHFQVGKFVTHANTGVEHVSRNIILKQSGTVVWYYLDAANMTESMSPISSEPFRSDLWGYLYYDVMVLWGDRFIRYFKTHHQQVTRYISVGCLWSEHIRLIKERPPDSVFRRTLDHRTRSLMSRRVSVFPTWYHIESITSPDDGMQFVQGIEKLLADFNDLFIVLKEKHLRWSFANHREYGGQVLRAIYHAYEALERHPRCSFPGNEVAVAELVAASELVISFPFTSVTIEAMGAGVKGLYYDPGGRYRGGPYDQMPGLIAHGYEELKSRVESLLYRTTEEEYRRYLEVYFRGETDPYLDGKAITRFRRLLTQSSGDRVQTTGCLGGG